MAPDASLLGVLALVLTAAAIGLALRRRRREARLQRLDAQEALDPAEIGAEHLGVAGTIVQFSTEYCSRCPGVRRVIAELAGERAGLEFVHVDLTHDAALAKRFAVLQTPTVLLIDREGRPSARLSGTLSRAALSDAIDALSGGPR